MFAAIRELYHIPRDPNLKLRDFPTLAQVIKFAHDRQPAASSGTPPAAPADKHEPAQEAPKARPAVASFEATNLIPRRVPTPVLRPTLDICKPTGVLLGHGERVIVMPDKGGVASALAQLLKGMGVEVFQIDRELPADALSESLNRCLAAGPVHGVFWLPALDDEGSHREMDLKSWREAVRIRLKSFYVTMRALCSQISPPGTFLVSATRLGGQHGYDPAGAAAPLGGAVVGFSKAYKREHIDALVKAVDFESRRDASQIAETLIEEALRDPGAAWSDLGQGHSIPDHRRRGQHRFGHHHGSGGGFRRHVLPARPGAGAQCQ
jgi:hypothetical protein